MKNNKVIKVEHIWCDSNDRWIYLEYNEQDKICGMNFMQGDEYEVYTFPIEKNSVGPIVFINKVMWAYCSADQIRAKY
jgi:hypothetical protein